VLYIFKISFADLLLCQSLLDLITMADTVMNGFGQLSLNASEPRAKVIHVLIQLLYCHQSFCQLFHPERDSGSSIFIKIILENDVIP